MEEYPIRKGFGHGMRQLAAYGVVSALSLGVDTAVLSILVRVFSMAPWLAVIAGFVCGAAVNYVLSTRYVFHQHRIVNNRRTEFLVFTLIGVLGLGISEAVVHLGLSMGLALEPSKLLAAGLTFLTNFILRKYLLFTAK